MTASIDYVVPCRQCCAPVELDREHWATPMCYACLTPPRSVPVHMPSLLWESPATFSADRLHRYTLTRVLTPPMLATGRTLRRCLFVMLNPSTATDTVDDPTIRRCKGFATSWGYDRLMVVNLFSLRSTDPKALYGDDGAEGDPENLTTILTVAEQAHLIVCGWGAHGSLRGRGVRVARELRAAGWQPRALKLTRDGHPGHPLYLRGDSEPVEWRAP